MQPSCPRGTVLLNDILACGYPCSPGSIELLTDDSLCVGSLCPSGMTKDGTDNSLCWKTAIAKVGLGCASGFTEWLPNLCYPDCPSGFRENAQSCLIPTTRRRLAQPSCPYLFSLTGDSCLPSPLFFLLCFAIVSVIVIVIYRKSCDWKISKDFKL